MQILYTHSFFQTRKVCSIDISVELVIKMFISSDIDLCHSLANMVAAVLGCPNRSNHLWYHLFEAEKLPNTHIVGYMVSY